MYSRAILAVEKNLGLDSVGAATPCYDQLNFSEDFMTAIQAFENMIKRCPTRGVAPHIFLKKLGSIDKANPEFLYKDVDHEWQIFRAGWLAHEKMVTTAQS